GRGLHRVPDRAAGTPHGTRWRDHLGLVWHRGREARGVQGRGDWNRQAPEGIRGTASGSTQKSQTNQEGRQAGQDQKEGKKEMTSGNYTLTIIKPDEFASGKAGKIIAHLE